ncbi:hypothetical protein [uncultured Aquitalea sp.]|uniref:hypothetical protein n=1 Tax=uncultured Aquitalea sp. TaxID=540272 RepID=UPI0025F4998E|nr:hypothetical protein [uncultured Aquitalea sp.]
MSPSKLPLLFLLLSLPLLSWASSYVDPVTRLSFTLPAGWKVRPARLDGLRVLRVIPPKPDQRERAAIEVTVVDRPQKRGDAPDRLARRFRQADDDREAAAFVRANPKTGRVVTEYREGSFVSGGLWIVRHNLHVFQPMPGKRIIEARCAANASEFKTYRRQMESICLSVNEVHK